MTILLNYHICRVLLFRCVVLFRCVCWVGVVSVCRLNLRHGYHSFCNISSNWVGVQHDVPAALFPGIIRYPLSRGYSGPQRPSGRCGNLARTEIRTLDRPARSEWLYRLIYPLKLIWFIRMLCALG